MTIAGKALQNEYAISKNVPVYLNGVKVYGEEPPKLSPTPTPTIDPSQTPDANASISVSYKCGVKDGTKNTIRATINIKNTGTTPVNLSISRFDTGLQVTETNRITLCAIMRLLERTK